MRFLTKRPKIEQIQEELNMVMEVMSSDVFIYLDLFVFSLIVTILLSPLLNSLKLSCVLFAASYGLSSGIYLAAFSRLFRKIK